MTDPRICTPEMHYFRTPLVDGEHCLCGQVVYVAERDIARRDPSPTAAVDDNAALNLTLSMLNNLTLGTGGTDSFGGFGGGASGGAGASGDW